MNFLHSTLFMAMIKMYAAHVRKVIISGMHSMDMTKLHTNYVGNLTDVCQVIFGAMHSLERMYMILGVVRRNALTKMHINFVCKIIVRPIHSPEFIDVPHTRKKMQTSLP